MKQQVCHIRIEEARAWDMAHNELVMEHIAFIHRGTGSNEMDSRCRMYKCSEASILRLAKIQEKLAE